MTRAPLPMHNNSLIKALSNLPKKKMTRFKSFAHSPYFNKHKDVTNLVDYLHQAYPNFTEKKCHREAISKALFPQQPHDQKKLAIVFTYTLRLFEQFLKTEQAMQDGFFDDPTLLLKELRENELNLQLKKYYQEINNGVIETTGKRDVISPAETPINLLAELDKTALSLGQADAPFLQNKQPLLDLQYLTEKLKDACELLQRGRLTNTTFTPTPLLESAVKLLKDNQLGIPMPTNLRLFADLYQLLQSGDTSLYDKLLVEISAKENQLTTDETKALHHHLQNFCIAMANTGKQVFLEKLFAIFKIQLKKSFLTDNGYMAEFHYKNIVTTALRLQGYQWVSGFIEKYKTHLHPSVMENAYTYNLANYHYHLGQYEKVLPLLLQVEYTDLRYNLDAKSLLLRTYYEMEEEEALFSLAVSFKQFLKRNKAINAIQKNGYYNLLKFTRSIFRLKINKGFMSKKRWEAGLEKLNKEMEGADVVFNLGWVREKVGELVTVKQ